MFTEKNTKNTRSLFTVFAVAMIALLAGASITNAQVVRNTLHDFVGTRATDWTTVALPPPATVGSYRFRTTGNPANPAPGAAFMREFDFGRVIDTTPGAFDGDSLVIGDYIGDNKSDLAVWRDDANALFYVAPFPVGTGGITSVTGVRWGSGATDIPVEGSDFTGDGKDDYTVVRVSGGFLNWYVLDSQTNTMKVIVFGGITMATVGPAIFPGADFNGDGRDEFVYLTRNSSGTVVNYFIGDANTGQGVITRSFGNYNSDTSLPPADYTGDGRADFVAVRQTEGSAASWYIGNADYTTTAGVTRTQFGRSDPTFMGDGDFPVRGDFDGDGRHDICVWRPSNQTFYYISTQFSNIQVQKAGSAGDTPIGSFAGY